MDQDEDPYEYEDHNEVQMQTHAILERLASNDVNESENFESEELELINSNQYLRNAYANRWYRYDNPDTYFVLVNDSSKSIMPGNSINYPYGNRNNRQLLETYGFTLTKDNPIASAEFRIYLSTNPKEALTSARQLLPDQKVLNDYENIDNYTEIAKVKANDSSEDFLCYLRSVLMTSNYDKEDKKDIMVSSPSVIDFEIIVMQYAIELITLYRKRMATNHKATIEDDEKALLAATDFASSSVYQYNIQYKQILDEALKLFKAKKEILQRLAELDEPLTSACFKALDCEKSDDFEQIFKRRVAMHQYFNNLKRNIVRINAMKE